ncbi:MAG: PH domain-containing protein [Chromatiaceae bacterium]|nr:PH domain-containing protein [Chromatiaceae bacterium]MBP9603689.1 PH domain-containing protein [Chromatiaceae bacterium]
MSQVLYEASPSLVRMNPFGSVLLILALVGGVILATPPVASGLSANLALDSRFVSLAGLAVAALAFLWLLVWFVKTKMDHLVIKADEIVWTHGLLSKQYTEIAQTSIRTVRVQQSILQRLMGAGDVLIYTAGDMPEVLIRGLPEPEKLRQYTSASERG